jgi:protein gp37
MCDPLDKMAPHPLRDRFWGLIEATPHLDWMILTKRPQLAQRYMPKRWLDVGWPQNAWFGFTAENQVEFDRRWPPASNVPAPLIFVSAEPLLEEYNLPADAARIGLFIAGGESGTIANCRRTPDDAFENMMWQCSALGIPFFMKQLDQVSYRGSVIVGERDGKPVRKPAYKHFPSFPVVLQVRDQPRIAA